MPVAGQCGLSSGCSGLTRGWWESQNGRNAGQARALWAALWPVIMHLMVRSEEEHLEMLFGDEYLAYCERTPRYLGLPKR